MHLKSVIEGNHRHFVVARYGVWYNLHDLSKNDMFWICGFYKTQFCKRIMLSFVIKFEICESILFTHLKFVSGSMIYNDDGFLTNIILYNDRLQFYTNITHLFFIFLNYG
jgi:hypothetical protein